MIELNYVPLLCGSGNADGTFASGEMKMTRPDNIDQELNIVIYQWEPENDELSKLYYLKRCLNIEAPKAFNVLAMWYIPNARCDKEYGKDKCNGKILLPLNEWTADIINAMNFDLVIGIEPHSAEQFEKCYKNSVATYPTMESLVRVRNAIGLKAKVQLVFPDIGSFKRYEKILVNRPDFEDFIAIKKERNNGNVENVQLEMGTLSTGKDFLIVDDICSKGSTALETAKLLLKGGNGEQRIFLLVAYLEQAALKNPHGVLEKDSPLTNVFVCGPNPFKTIYHSKVKIIEYDYHNYDTIISNYKKSHNI